MQRAMSLIVVDDEKAVLEMLKQSLQEEGQDCEVYTNGEEALARLRDSEADVLVTDIALEGMPGLELTREAKRIRPDMIVIAMTGYVEDFSYDQAIEAGASDFIKKPFTIKELLMRIRHVKMQERLRSISITDDLTGLLNRRGFFALVDQQIKIADRIKTKLVLLFADMDDFKAINDTWGHQKGDEALIALAGIFRETFRESDIIARMGGDEFAVLLIDTPDRHIQLIKSRLQQNIDSHNERSEPYRLSVSAGVAVHDHGQQRSIDDLLKEADALMYEEKQRKKSARNQH